jgi:hypothetical protein
MKCSIRAQVDRSKREIILSLWCPAGCVGSMTIDNLYLKSSDQEALARYVAAAINQAEIILE